MCIRDRYVSVQWGYDIKAASQCLMVALQLCDLWRDGFSLLKSPLRTGAFVATAALMMLFRNNGVYAFVLLTPFVVLLARSKRLRVLWVRVLQTDFKPFQVNFTQSLNRDTRIVIQFIHLLIVGDKML